MNSYTTLCWLIRGGFSSVTLRWSAIFLRVKTGCSCWLIFVPRSPSRLRTTSADFWSLNGNVIRTGLLAGVWAGSVGWWRRLIAELMSFSGYFNFKISLLSSYILAIGSLASTISVLRSLTLFLAVTVCTGCQHGFGSAGGALYLFSFCERRFQGCRRFWWFPCQWMAIDRWLLLPS